MRAVVITKHGGPGVLAGPGAPRPGARPGRCASTSRRRASTSPTSWRGWASTPTRRRRPAWSAMRWPARSSSWARAVGSGPDHHQGQRVIAGTEFGGYASQVVVPADDVVALPDGLSVRAGRGDSRQLRDGVDGSRRLRQPASPANACSIHCGRRRRRHRRDAGRQAPGRRGLRHVLARQARAHLASSASTTRSTTRARLGAGLAEVRSDHGRDRRQEPAAQLRVARAPAGA